MIRPNFVGSQILYLNPSSDKLTTANLAAIDTATSDAISPYAYTATVRDDYDAFNFLFDDAGSNIVAGQRVAFGLFLSPENDKQNLLFQVSGRAYLSGRLAGAFSQPKGCFFFGRKATDNTVVSSKAGVNNTLAKFMYLPSNSVMGFDEDSLVTLQDSLESQVFSLSLSGGFVYCFGYMIDNIHIADYAYKGGVSLAFRKYDSEISAFRPSR